MSTSIRQRIPARHRLLNVAGLCCALVLAAFAGLGWLPHTAAARPLSPVCTSVTLGASPISPEPTGEQITLTGTASGCTDPSPLYRFWVQPSGGSTLLIQDWTTGTATWNSMGLTPGSYTLTVWAKDALSTTGSYDVATTASFTLSVATAPGTVTLSSPSNGATNAGTTPTLSWSAPTGATTGTTTYTVTLWDPFAGTAGTKIGDYNAGTSTSYTIGSGVLASGKTYEWNVSACNGQACSGYGPWWTFSTSASPHTAQQSSPSNGATGQTLTPTLTWTAPDNAIPGTTTYTVSIWDAYAAPAGHLLGNLATTTALTATVPVAETLLYSQVYYWNVTACNGGSCSGYNSQWFSFTTQNQPAATLSGAGLTEVLNGDFADAAIGTSTIPGWTGTATIAADSRGFTYAQHVSSLTSANLNLDFASLDNSGNAADWFRIAYGPIASGGKLTVKYNGVTVFTKSGPTPCPFGAPCHWFESAFAIPYMDGASGALVLTGTGSFLPSVAYLQRLDGPAGRGGTNPAVVTGAFTTSATDLALGGLAGTLSFGRVYNSAGVSAGARSSNCDVTAGPLGPKWSHTWQYGLILSDTSATPTAASIELPGGPTETFTLVSGSYVPPPGLHASLTHSGTTWTLLTASQVHYTFTQSPSSCNGWPGNLTSIADRNGNTTTLANDSYGRLHTITDAGGRALTLGYNASSQLTSVTDGTGTVSYTYDATTMDLATVTDVRGGTTSYAYTGHALTSVTDPRSNVVLRPTYDSQSRLSSVQDAASGTVSYSYASPGAGAMQVTDQRSHTSTQYFDSGLRVTDALDPYGKRLSGSHDSGNNLAGAVDPLNNAVAFTYDTNGNVLTATDAANYTTTYTYDALNDVLTVTDPLGQKTTNTYNTAGNLTASVFKNAAGATVDSRSYTVNSLGQVTAAQDPRGYSGSFGYNSYGDRTTVTDPLSHTTTTAYDYAGRPTSVTDPLTHASSATYDHAGHRLTVTDALSHTVTSTYDADGNLATAVDANSHTTTYAYTSRGLLLTATDANTPAGVTTYGYDAAGNRTSVQDAKLQTTSYSFDNDNRPLTVTDPQTNVLYTLTYHDAGRVATRKDGKNQTTTYSYTVRSQLDHATYPDSSTVQYQYDALGNRTSMADRTGVTSYSYDPRNRLSSVTFPGSKTVGYSYDADGNRASIIYPGGSNQVTYGYDTADRLTSVTDWNTKQTTYAYDNAGWS